MPVILSWLLRLGPANPIAVRLVYNASRRVKHLYIRAAYLAVLIIVLLWALLLTTRAGALDYQQLAQAGAGSFIVITYLQIGLICVLAPVFMGGAIAQEANPRTWDILLTTPLTASEIVLGNLLGRLFFVLGLLFASLPLFALTQFFGGVPGRSIFASYLIAACAAILVGALAISLSVSRLVGKRAFFGFYIAVVTYVGATVAIDILLRRQGLGASGGQGVTWMTALNPFLAVHALLNPATYPRALEGSQSGLARWFLERPVTTWCAGSSALSFLFVFLSTLTVRSGGLRSLGENESGLSWFDRIMGGRARGGEGEGGGRHRAPRHVWHNPITWREAASRNSQPAKIVARWSFIAAGLIAGLGVVFAFARGSIGLDSYRFILLSVVWTELAVVALVGIITAASAISKEREDGTLDLLLTTPITARAYLVGKLRGLIAYLLPLLSVPLGTLAFASFYALLGSPGLTAAQAMEETSVRQTAMSLPAILPEAALLAPVVIIPFIAFCVMVGLHWSLRSKGILTSVVGSVAVVGAIAGVVGLCGWNASSGLVGLGPVLASLSPASFISMVVLPADQMHDTLAEMGLGATRLTAAAGAVVAMGVYSGVCYAILSSMVRTFDVTVRRLAGNK
jgi:ABC-type transport system involved in multi-copper enzyme maturation permease subunit